MGWRKQAMVAPRLSKWVGIAQLKKAWHGMKHGYDKAKWGQAMLETSSSRGLWLVGVNKKELV